MTYYFLFINKRHTVAHFMWKCFPIRLTCTSIFLFFFFLKHLISPVDHPSAMWQAILHLNVAVWAPCHLFDWLVPWIYSLKFISVYHVDTRPVEWSHMTLVHLKCTWLQSVHLSSMLTPGGLTGFKGRVHPRNKMVNCHYLLTPKAKAVIHKTFGATKTFYGGGD